MHFVWIQHSCLDSSFCCESKQSCYKEVLVHGEVIHIHVYKLRYLTTDDGPKKIVNGDKATKCYEIMNVKKKKKT